MRNAPALVCLYALVLTTLLPFPATAQSDKTRKAIHPNRLAKAPVDKQANRQKAEISELAPTALQTDIVGPAGSEQFGAAVTVLPNGNIVVSDPGYGLGS